ncbi:hypothetical protein GCM10009111_34140 [Colwellia asteriadis]|uniref:Uncharacterized protein n=1 Tax=Colwellia asteriadis TaxID=517723 RepID=A0ABN1LB89_9GAMM
MQVNLTKKLGKVVARETFVKPSSGYLQRLKVNFFDTTRVIPVYIEQLAMCCITH